MKRLLRHPIYIGKVARDGELYQGEYEATAHPEVWRLANERLKQEDVRNFRVKRSVVVSATASPAGDETFEVCKTTVLDIGC